MKPCGKHRQRAARLTQSVVDAFAVRGHIPERTVVHQTHLVIQSQVQTGSTKKAIGFYEFRLVRNQFRGTTTGHGAGEGQLRRPIDRMQISQTVKGPSPGSGRYVRYTVFIAVGFQPAASVFQRQSLHVR